MITAWIAWVRALLFPVAEQTSPGVDTSEYERFALPYAFKPQLSFTEALVAVAGALLASLARLVDIRFLGYLQPDGLVLHPKLFCAFCRAAAAACPLSRDLHPLMVAISTMVRTVSPRRP